MNEKLLLMGFAAFVGWTLGLLTAAAYTTLTDPGGDGGRP